MEESDYAEVGPPDKAGKRVKRKDAKKLAEKQKTGGDKEKRSKSPGKEIATNKSNRRNRDQTEILENGRHNGVRNKDERKHHTNEKNGDIPRSKGRTGKHGSSPFTEVPEGPYAEVKQTDDRRGRTGDQNGNISKSREKPGSNQPQTLTVGEGPYAEVKEKEVRGTGLKEPKGDRKKDSSNSRRKSSRERGRKPAKVPDDPVQNEVREKRKGSSKRRDSKERRKVSEEVPGDTPYAEVTGEKGEQKRDRKKRKGSSDTSVDKTEGRRTGRGSLKWKSEVHTAMESPDILPYAEVMRQQAQQKPGKDIQSRDLPNVPGNAVPKGTESNRLNTQNSHRKYDISSRESPDYDGPYAEVRPKRKDAPRDIGPSVPQPPRSTNPGPTGSPGSPDAPYATVPPKGQRHSRDQSSYQVTHTATIEAPPRTTESTRTRGQERVIKHDALNTSGRPRSSRHEMPNVEGRPGKDLQLQDSRLNPTDRLVDGSAPRDSLETDHHAPYAVVKPKSLRTARDDRSKTDGPPSANRTENTLASGSSRQIEATGVTDGKQPTEPRDHHAPYAVVKPKSLRTVRDDRSKTDGPPPADRTENTLASGSSRQIEATGVTDGKQPTEPHDHHAPYAVVKPKSLRTIRDDKSKTDGPPLVDLTKNTLASGPSRQIEATRVTDGKQRAEPQDPEATYAFVPPKSQRMTRGGKSRVDEVGRRASSDSKNAAASHQGQAGLDDHDAPYALVPPKSQRRSRKDQPRLVSPSVDKEGNSKDAPKVESLSGDYTVNEDQGPYTTVPLRGERLSQSKKSKLKEPSATAECNSGVIPPAETRSSTGRSAKSSRRSRGTPVIHAATLPNGAAASVDDQIPRVDDPPAGFTKLNVLSEVPLSPGTIVWSEGETDSRPKSPGTTTPKRSRSARYAERTHSQRTPGHDASSLPVPDLVRSASLSEGRRKPHLSPVASPRLSIRSLIRGDSRSSWRSTSSELSESTDDAGGLRRNSLYDLIPEEPDAPLPTLFEAEIQPGLPTVVEAPLAPPDEAPLGFVDGEAKEGIYNPAFHGTDSQPGTTDVSNDVVISSFEDEGYKKAVAKRAREIATKKRRRRKLCFLIGSGVILVLVLLLGGVLAVLFRDQIGSLASPND